ncbi:MAG: hypothetical protein OHK0023_02110 [Anaerolineae bacterium]
MKPIRRLLCVKIADIGDLILITPALAALREALPDTQVDVLTTPHAAPILSHTQLADQVHLYSHRTFERARDLLKPSAIRATADLSRQLRRQGYDAVLFFHQFSTPFGALKNAAIAFATGAPHRLGLDNGRGWFLTQRVPDRGFGVKHQAEYWLEVASLLGAKPDTSRFPIRVGFSEADSAWAADKLPDGTAYIAVHPGSGGLNLARRWNAESLAVTARQIAANYPSSLIVVVGGQNDPIEAFLHQLDRAKVDYLNLAGQTTLNQLAALMQRCAAFLGADSGVMHIAASAPQLKLYTLFGPTHHGAWQAWRPANPPIILRSGAVCSPCAYVYHGVGLRGGCASQACMKAITPEMVLSERQDISLSGREKPPDLRVLGVPIDKLTFAQLNDQLAAWINQPNSRARMICTANPELVMIAQRDSNFFNILQRASLVSADGVGLLWAAKRLGVPLPERVTGSDGLPKVAERAAREGWRLFLLGAGNGVAQQVADVLIARFPTLMVVGTYSGSPAPTEEDAIVARVNAAMADILFVAYGSPAQEAWIARNLPRLQVKVAIGVGGAFDFVAGVAQRAPEWMQQAGIEWLHRLISQPRRITRMANRLPRFVWAVLRRGSRPPRRFWGLQHDELPY